MHPIMDPLVRLFCQSLSMMDYFYIMHILLLLTSIVNQISVYTKSVTSAPQILHLTKGDCKLMHI